MRPEIIVNLWAFHDAGMGLVYALAGRAYSAVGSREEKLALLQRLSRTDHAMAKRYQVPGRFQVSSPDGRVIENVTTLAAVHDQEAQLFEELLQNIESDLPPLVSFHDEQTRHSPQELPLAPLCAVTVLYEDEAGDARAIISDEDRAWVTEQERARGRG